MNQVQVKQPERLNALINSPQIKQRFEEMLGKKSSAFLSSILSAVGTNPALKKCDPMSVISSAAIAASLDLPINPSLGQSYIIPYGSQAQFQIGWKGFVQLALRTGQYKTINVACVYDGQLLSRNSFTGEIDLIEEKNSDEVIGYLCYFKLVNGFEKYHYMTKQECDAHGKHYSQMYKRGKGLWVENFDVMAMKTVVKQALSKFGILSTEMQKAFDFDQAAIDVTTGEPDYLDSTIDNDFEETPKTPINTLKQMESSNV